MVWTVRQSVDKDSNSKRKRSQKEPCIPRIHSKRLSGILIVQGVSVGKNYEDQSRISCRRAWKCLAGDKKLGERIRHCLLAPC